MKRLILSGLAGLAALAVAVPLLFTGNATAVLPEAVTPAPAGLYKPSFSGFRSFEAKGEPPTWAAHAKAPARLTRPAGPAPAIVGGRVSDLTGIPGAVLVQTVTLDERNGAAGPVYGYQQCTGTILKDLGPRFVVTAAHCIEEDAVRFDVFYGGENDGATRGTMKRLWGFKAYLCPDYERATLIGDCAIIELVEAAHLAPHEMARLATPAELAAVAIGDEVVVAGWGTTEGGETSGKEPSPVLKEALQVVARWSPLKSAVASPSGAVEGTCQGDSGGSARKWSNRRVVIGFLSYVDQIPGIGVCREPGYRSTFTGAAYLRWILGLAA